MHSQNQIPLREKEKQKSIRFQGRNAMKNTEENFFFMVSLDWNTYHNIWFNL
jgi:hypothetical protein